MNNYGEIIRNYRLENDYTQDELGRLLKVSTSAIAMYESCERVPRDSVKLRIAELIGKPVGEIFFAK
ncbi:MAG: helix-turn-helix domain-containing protein [Clostridiales bacterium]|nr:helix-turn-helix domain-containing protein [Clostridiales bacterium]